VLGEEDSQAVSFAESVTSRSLAASHQPGVGTLPPAAHPGGTNPDVPAKVMDVKKNAYTS
jgi:hypothetical protein